MEKENFNAEEIFKRLCAAEPYKMDEAYKMSVYLNMEEQLKKWVMS